MAKFITIGERRESGWRTALGRDDVNIQAAFSVGSKGNLLAVRAPDRLGVVSSMGRRWQHPPSCFPYLR